MKKPAPRLPLLFPVEFRKNYSRKSNYGDLKNISLTGAFLIHKTSELSSNDKINIYFNVSGRQRVLTASVIWLTENGCGIKFHHESNRDIQIVDDLMYLVNGKRMKNKTVLDEIFNQIH